jgi:hypothetical protein
MVFSSLGASTSSSIPQPAGVVNARYLFGPVVDFVCLGGSSLILVPLLFLQPAEAHRESLAVIMLLLANAVNHPHFAHSYQVFYRNFRSKCFGTDYRPALRTRYVLAGIVVPLLLTLFFAASFLSNSARMLGCAGNFMVFVVGWHYVKQGYGLLMVDAALKKHWFQSSDKQILLINCYAVWILSWILINTRVSENELWGIRFYAIEIPMILRHVFILGAIAAGGLTMWTLAVRWKASGNTPPYNGIVAYTASLYGWLLLVQLSPLLLLVAPALHSIQYLAVVWRFQINYEQGRDIGYEPKRTCLFAFIGIVLGFLGFWAVPILLDILAPYSTITFGNTACLFAFWVFINVHHYFLDSVIWRRDNPDMRRYLLGYRT